MISDAASRSSLCCSWSTFASFPSAWRMMRSLSCWMYSKSSSDCFLTSTPFLYHSPTLVGFTRLAASNSSSVLRLRSAAVAADSRRLFSTSSNPLSTSDDVSFIAIMAMKTRYIRLIIFWRGELGLFDIPDIILWGRSVSVRSTIISSGLGCRAVAGRSLAADSRPVRPADTWAVAGNTCCHPEPPC